jgi:hypothetical protein
MGYVEETGAAQHLRDARITTIYEGTTGIQANDLIGRKTARDAGAAARDVIAAIRNVAGDLGKHSDRALHPVGAALAEATAALESSVDWMVKAYGEHARAAHAVSVPFLRLWGLVAGGWQLGRAALVASKRLSAGEGDPAFMRAKIATARFYASALLPQAAALARTVTDSGEAALELPADQL